MSKWGWYSLVWKYDKDSYDSIVENTIFGTEDECLKAIERAKKDDNEWELHYNYSKPRNVKVEIGVEK